MSNHQLKNIVLEAKKIKTKNKILTTKLSEYIQTNFRSITEHYDGMLVKRVILETIANREDDTVENLVNDFFKNLSEGYSGKSNDTINEYDRDDEDEHTPQPGKSKTSSASVGTLDEGWADVGKAAGNLLIGQEATAGLRKLAGMATGTATGSMSRADIMARDNYIKDFTSKVSAAIDSGVKSGVLVKAPAAAPAPTQTVAEGQSNKPKIRTYTKTYADGSTTKRYEVLDYKGRRAPGQGNEGFDDLGNAKQFLTKNKIKLSDPLNEATTRSQTISEYVVSTVEYYAQQAGVTSIEQFQPTIVSLAQQIEQTYPRGAKQLIQKLANVVYSLTSSTMQQGVKDDNLTQKTDQVMNLINSMNKPDDIDDVAHIAKAAIQKLYKGDQAMMSRMFNAVEVKAQERMGK